MNVTDSRAGKVNASPWAVKKINSKCATKQMAVYQKRLNKEAQLLKGIHHPNIVGEARRRDQTFSLVSAYPDDALIEVAVV